MAGDVGYQRTFDTDQNQPTVDVTEAVGELKGVASDELSSLYDRIDHAVDDLFSDPPRASAEIEVTFSYEVFRITIGQDGRDVPTAGSVTVRAKKNSDGIPAD